MSLLATAGATATRDGGLEGKSVREIGGPALMFYLLCLTTVVLLPLLPLARRGRPRSESQSSATARLVSLIWSKRRILSSSFGLSVLVQLLAATSLWFCARAVGAEVPYLTTVSISAAIFMSGALPLSVGGFGPREFAASFVLPLVGVSPESAVASSILYGLTASLQGVMAAPLLVLQRNAK